MTKEIICLDLRCSIDLFKNGKFVMDGSKSKPPCFFQLKVAILKAAHTEMEKVKCCFLKNNFL